MPEMQFGTLLHFGHMYFCSHKSGMFTNQSDIGQSSNTGNSAPALLQAETLASGIDSAALDTLLAPVGPVRAIIEEAVVIERPVEEQALPNFFHTVYDKSFESKPRLVIQDGWILPLLLTAFFFLALIQTLYPREILTILTSLVKRNGLRKLEEMESTQIWRCLLLFILLFLIVSPVFLYQTAGFLGWETAFLPYLSPYFQLMLIGAGLLGFKILVVAFLGNLFLVEQDAVRYVTGIVIMNALLAAVLVPVCLGIHLSSAPVAGIILKSGLALGALFYLFSVANGIVTGWRNQMLSKFHLFLYFCTLEILPVFIIIKTVKSLI